MYVHSFLPSLVSVTVSQDEPAASPVSDADLDLDDYDDDEEEAYGFLDPPIARRATTDPAPSSPRLGLLNRRRQTGYVRLEMARR
jgi:hypothetical protein